MVAILVSSFAPAILSAQIRFERTGYRLTSLGEKVAVSARVFDSRRRAVPNAPIAWRIQDVDIAAVDPKGVVQSLKPGFTKIWAISGSDSASALILVDQWAAKFGFSPSTIHFDALGSKTPLTIQVRDATNHPITKLTRRTASCRSVNDRIALFDPSGQVISKANGSTWIRCTDRGIADSVRVIVQQRPKTFQAVERNVQRMQGDTLRIRVRAQDRAGNEITDLPATFASLTPAYLTIDPVSGLARLNSVGDARVVVQSGDQVDTVAVKIVQSPNAAALGLVSSAPTDSAPGATTTDAVKGPALSITSMYPAINDTAKVLVTARDATGLPVSAPELDIRSSDTTIVAVLTGKRNQEIVGKKTGQAYVVVRFGTLVDSTLVNVHPAVDLNTTASTAADEKAYVRPAFDSAMVKRYRDQQAAFYSSLKQNAQAGRELSGRALGGFFEVGTASISNRINSELVESRSGILYGGFLNVLPFRWLKFTGDFHAGTFTASGDRGEEMKYAEAGGSMMLVPLEWLEIGGGFHQRAQVIPTHTTIWQIPNFTIRSRFSFVGGTVSTTTGFSLLPFTKAQLEKDVTGQPGLASIAGEAGIEIHAAVTAGLTYYVEHFAWPVIEGVQRGDQFSVLKLRIGYQLQR